MRLKTKFQDEDFELGEVVNAKISDLTCLAYEDDIRFKLTASAQKGGEHTFFYFSITEFLEMWEDAPDSEGHWHIRDGEVYWSELKPCIRTEKRKEIGNYFGTKEEAKRAVEKLKAWKRLKDKGLEFDGYVLPDRKIGLSLPESFFPCKGRIDKETQKDLDLLFSGEEE